MSEPRFPERHGQPELAFRVVGDPKTKGSVKAFIPRKGDGSMVTRPDGDPMVVKTDDTGRAGKQWLANVGDTAMEARAAARVALFTGPLFVAITFVLQRPKGHYRTGANAHLLRDGASAYPDKRPDIDKLERAVLDGLKGVVWRDDGQVVASPSVKVYGDPVCAEVAIWCLPATVAEAL